MFGKSKKRGALIKELVEQRLESRGVNSIDSRLKVKSLGMLAVMSMPEATMVVILEGVVKAQSRGIPLGQELIRVEQQRARQGHDSSAFARIIEKAKLKNIQDQYGHILNLIQVILITQQKNLLNY